MNKRLLLIGLLLITGLFIYNKEILFFFQNRFLQQHRNQSASLSIQNFGSPDKPFSSHRPFSKAWAHRVNTLERYFYLQDAFKGFEVDVLFNSRGNFLDVGHPPSPSIQLSFEKYLQLPAGNWNFFWMDLKNLDSMNVQNIITLLNKMDTLYHIKERVIIESDNIKELVKISGKGYFTSYYYNTSSYTIFLKEKGAGILFDKIDAISQSDDYNDTFKSKFPFKPRLLWALSMKNYLSHSIFRSFDKDSSILVYLVNIKSPYYR